MHRYIHSQVHSYRGTFMQRYIHPEVHSCRGTFMHRYIHAQVCSKLVFFFTFFYFRFFGCLSHLRFQGFFGKASLFRVQRGRQNREYVAFQSLRRPLILRYHLIKNCKLILKLVSNMKILLYWPSYIPKLIPTFWKIFFYWSWFVHISCSMSQKKC